jgi:DNA-directed RNA polymerase subunit RPC12/RpoP
MTSEITSLVCPSCGAKARVDALGEHAVCEYCGNEQLLSPEKQPVLRPEVAQPAEVRIMNDGRSAKLIQRWFSFRFIFLAFFAFAWDAFLVFWYGIALVADAPWIMFVFPIVHLAIGACITYCALAGFINRTILEVTPETLSIRFEPLPWIGKKKLRTSDLKQLYCKQKIVHHKGGYSIRYTLYAVTAANTEMKLLGGLENPNTAIFMEQQLERWLKIKDRLVAGELPRQD